MKRILYFIFIPSLTVLSFSQCVTANINQPPHIIENSYPGSRLTPYRVKKPDKEDSYGETDEYTNPYLKKQAAFPPSKNHKKQTERNIEDTSEDAFFDALSNQDPYLNKNCFRCYPDNKPPGYNFEKTAEKSNRIPEIDDTSPSGTVYPEPGNEVTILLPQKQETSGNPAKPATEKTSFGGYEEEGLASWYGKEFNGRPTASGEIFDSNKLTAAHRTLPLGTVVLVKNLENNREAILRINDRGPFKKDRILDVSEKAAEVLDFKNKGLAKVRIKVLEEGSIIDKNDGATAFFYKPASFSSQVSPYDSMMKEKEENIRRRIQQVQNFPFYAVQVGSFLELKNVIRLVEELEKKYTYPVSILRKDVAYVVRVGKFAERYGAELLKQKLEDDGYLGFITYPHQ